MKQRAEQKQDNEYETTGQCRTVKFRDYKDSVMRVAGILWVLTMPSKDILRQAKGIILVEFTQIR